MRPLLIYGSGAALLAALRCQARTSEKFTQLQRWVVEAATRIGHIKTAVAWANNWYGSAGRCGAKNGAAAVTGRVQSPPDGGVISNRQ